MMGRCDQTSPQVGGHWSEACGACPLCVEQVDHGVCDVWTAQECSALLSSHLLNWLSSMNEIDEAAGLNATDLSRE